MQHEILSGVLSMMEKVAVSKLMASHTQIRKGRRPYRVSTLLEKDKPMHDVPELLAEKTADLKKQKRIAEVISEAIKSGLHPKKAFKMVEQGGTEALRAHAPKAFALQAFETAEKLSSIRLASFFDELDKIAGVGVDLRLLKKSGVTNISMPTEESLAQAKSKLERTQRVGGDLKVKPPEPNIRAVATKTK